MRLIYSRRSLRHLTSIYNYIAKDNPKAARNVVESIRRVTKRLEKYPYSGRPGPMNTRILKIPGLP
jgi:plasmid stabilization system protein ParE